MPDFSNMTFDELTKKGGYDCACGRHHSTDLEFLRIGRGVVGTVVEGLKVVGATKPMVIADQNTYKAAGEKVVEILEKHNIPYTLHIIPQKDVKLIPPSSSWAAS